MLVSLVCLAGAALGAAPGAREQAELLARVGESRYRLALLRPGRGDLNEALRALEEAHELDRANLRALAYLGLARLDAAERGAAARPAIDAFASAREPLDELFRLSGGWVDPATRRLLKDVAAFLDRTLEGERPWPEDVRAWWRAWRERLDREKGAAPAGGVLRLVEALRAAPVAWERERAAEELGRLEAAGPGEPDESEAPQVTEALATALRGDESPWVRAASSRALAALRPETWDVLVAGALRNDASVWVRRTCAEALGGGNDARVGKPAHTALVAALETDTPRVAAAAARALGRLGGAEGDLVRALEAPSALVRDEAAEALRLHADDVAVAAKLRPLMDSPAAATRAAALQAIGPGPGRLPDEMMEKFTLLLADSDPSVRAAAARALFRRDLRGAAPQLGKLLGDEDMTVRLDAADTLLAAGDEAARPVLEEVARSCAPLTVFPNRSDARTVGDAAKWILAGRGEKEKPGRPPPDEE